MISILEIQAQFAALLSITLPLLAVAVSLSALAVAILNYRRKSSLRVRGTYRIASSVYGEDKYVSSVTLENLKDRSITIFGIYLRIGYNHYLDIQKFEEAPLIIRPFETWHSEYEPIDFYAVSTSKIDLNDLLWDRKIKQQLTLSTGDGKYVVKEFSAPWNPVTECLLSNPLTVPVYPVGLVYKGKSLGGNTKFVIEVVTTDGQTIVVPVHSEEYGTETLRNVVLTKESLESSKTLEKFLTSKKKAGVLVCNSIEVIDVESIRRSSKMFDGKERVKAKPHGAIVYHIIGPLLVWYNRRKRKRQKAD